MLRAFRNIHPVEWVASQLYVNCDVIHASQLPLDVQTLAGASEYAYVLTPQSIYLVNKQQRTFVESALTQQQSQFLAQSLNLAPLEEGQALKLVEENASMEKIRVLSRAARVRPPITKRPLANTLVLVGYFGVAPYIATLIGLSYYLWYLSLPVAFGYAIYKRHTILQKGIEFLRYARALAVSDIPQTVGEWAADIVAFRFAQLIKALGSLSILLFVGLNSWSIIAIYGIYRYTEEEWKVWFKNTVQGLSTFGFAFFNRLGGISFYKKIGMGCAIALLFGMEIYYGGLLSGIALITVSLQAVTTFIGFKALYRDLSYALKNPLRVLFKNAGKLLGIFWGHFLAYSLIAGHIEGTLGPAVGHVVNNGFLSGIFSSFLMPGGWFTTQGGFMGLFVAKIEYFLNTVLTSVFITTEMQTQGTFYGTVGPTLLQLFFFMAVGAAIGHFVEKTVDRVNQGLERDSPDMVASARENISTLARSARQRGYISPWHIAYLSVYTGLVMCSEGGATMIAYAGGSIIGATTLTASSMIAVYVAIHLLAFGLRQAYRNYTQPPALEVINAVEPVQIQHQPIVADNVPQIQEDHPLVDNLFLATPVIVPRFRSKQRAILIGAEPRLQEENALQDRPGDRVGL